VICPRPLMRSDSVRPGTKKIRLTAEFSNMFVKVISFLFPGRSGSTIVRSSSTAAKPGKSPRGETSGAPSRFADAITTNGDSAMNPR